MVEMNSMDDEVMDSITAIWRCVKDIDMVGDDDIIFCFPEIYKIKNIASMTMTENEKMREMFERMFVLTNKTISRIDELEGIDGSDDDIVDAVREFCEEVKFFLPVIQ